MRTFAAAIPAIVVACSANAAEPAFPLDKVLSAVSDYQDSTYYRAILVQGQEDADLYIFTRPDYENFVLTVRAPNIAITGIGGTDAYLKRNEAGNLQVISQNSAIGRHRWEQILTIVYRNEQFIVGGYTYSYYDTLEVDENGEVLTGECDVNLLTGKGIIDGEKFQTKLKAFPVKEWTFETAPNECSWE
ncbi:MAG: hypothetical protein AAF478_08505 [Pseudomonadota bacterium]